jgi:hypothetical protein
VSAAHQIFPSPDFFSAEEWGGTIRLRGGECNFDYVKNAVNLFRAVDVLQDDLEAHSPSRLSDLAVRWRQSNKAAG